jgi:hypothetical protein
MLRILTKWNSVYTIFQDPDVRFSEKTGDMLGLRLSVQASSTKRNDLLKPLYKYFATLRQQADANLRELDQKGVKEYEAAVEDGHPEISWFSMQIHQQAFAQKVLDSLTKNARMTVSHQSDVYEASAIEMEYQYTKAIENRGGIVFGQGGGARGGFDFDINVDFKKGAGFGGDKKGGTNSGGLGLVGALGGFGAFNFNGLSSGGSSSDNPFNFNPPKPDDTT